MSFRNILSFLWYIVISVSFISASLVVEDLNKMVFAMLSAILILLIDVFYTREQ